MAGYTLLKLRPIARRDEDAHGYESRRLQIDFGPFVRENRPDVVLLTAIGAFVVGLTLWGLLTMSIVAGIDRVLGETESRQTAKEDTAFDCASFGAVRALSADDEAKLRAQCGASLPGVAPVSASVSTAAETDVVARTTNRASCGEIRGTAYLSDEERTWFLDNCVTSN